MSNDRVTVGIDLGTTYSLAAIMEPSGPRVLTNSLGEALTPSAVSFDADGTVLVGRAARARRSTHPEATATSFKRDMGTSRRYALAGHTLRPEELSAMVLQQVKRDAEQSLGLEIAEAVVTVPAYFGELQRRATRDACTLAGIYVERIINEPTAAALAYGLHQRESELRAVVLDLGGGTFDVTVLEIIEGVIEIQSSAGDVRLGGDDFVDALVEHCQARIHKKHGANVAHGKPAMRLWESCETAKKLLSTKEQTRLALPEIKLANGKSVDVEIAVTRDEAEHLWGPLLTRARGPIMRALRDADADGADMEQILCVGGATRIPCFRALAAGIFGRLPSHHLPPDEAVALGAAIQAALKVGADTVKDLVVTDVAPYSLGVSTGTSVGGRIVSGLFEPILERGTVLPASRFKTFHTLSNNQTKILVEVYQGEHSLVQDNQKIGEYEVEGIPPAKAGVQPIEIRFTYDLNGLLEVESTISSTKRTAALVIDRSAGRLTTADLEKAREALQRLKFHPADALPNRTALARADALYIELTGAERDILGTALAQLRLALETQDPTTIDQARATLLAVMDDFGR